MWMGCPALHSSRTIYLGRYLSRGLQRTKEPDEDDLPLQCLLAFLLKGLSAGHLFPGCLWKLLLQTGPTQSWSS